MSIVFPFLFPVDNFFVVAINVGTIAFETQVLLNCSFNIKFYYIFNLFYYIYNSSSRILKII